VRKLQDDLSKKYLKIARESIKNYLDKGKFIQPKINEKKGACFVTLTINKELRGCIGTLEAFQPLELDIAKNSVNAAFFDPRFPRLTKEEFDKIKIEISILSKPKKINYKDIFKKIIPKKHGVVIEKNGHKATFLPQVWEHFKIKNNYDKEKFFEELCFKAGLSGDCYKNKLNVFIYDVKKFEEEKT
jgi:AmmeMemoRadiSam system protein A